MLQVTRNIILAAEVAACNAIEASLKDVSKQIVSCLENGEVTKAISCNQVLKELFDDLNVREEKLYELRNSYDFPHLG